jgi:LacI family transcriptional regulator
MTRFLIELGHCRLGFIKGHPNQTASEERWRGFSAAVAERVGHSAGQSMDQGMDRGMDQETCKGVAVAQVEQGFFSYRSGLDAARKLLGAERPPTAIFASNDDMAAAVVSEAHRRGLDVPRDLTVVGFDDTLIASTIWPELTTIQQPIAEMAGEAIAMLVRAVRGSRQDAAQEATRADRLHKLINHALVTRDSAACPPS